MAKTGAYIQDVHLLEQLNQRILGSGEAMSNIDVNVINYINGVRDAVQDQLDSIRIRLEEAEANLSNAENALTACYASQMCNEFGELSPSCSMEENNVESARGEVEKWRTRYGQGQQIVSECQQEFSDYMSGGHELVRIMCEHQAPKASQLLRECIDRLGDILGHNLAASDNSSAYIEPDVSVSTRSDEVCVSALKNQFNV